MASNTGDHGDQKPAAQEAPPAPPPAPPGPGCAPQVAAGPNIAAVMDARTRAFNQMVRAATVSGPGWLWVVVFVVLNVAIYSFGVASTIWSFIGTRTGIAGLAVADFAVGALTFGMVLGWTQSMREALAGSLFLVYLAILGNILISEFYKQLDTDLGRNLLNILTASVTAIVAFWFASRTTEQVFVVREAGRTAREP